MSPQSCASHALIRYSPVYSSAVPSPNHSLICAIPMYTLDTRANFTLSTVPLGTASDSLPATLSFRLARAIAMQADCSDILGRINGLENDRQPSSARFLIAVG